MLDAAFGYVRCLLHVARGFLKFQDEISLNCATFVDLGWPLRVALGLPNMKRAQFATFIH